LEGKGALAGRGADNGQEHDCGSSARGLDRDPSEDHCSWRPAGAGLKSLNAEESGSETLLNAGAQAFASKQIAQPSHAKTRSGNLFACSIALIGLIDGSSVMIAAAGRY
jgi:hypothetical protein